MSWSWVPTTRRDGGGWPVVGLRRGHWVPGLFESAGECLSGVNVLKLLARFGVVTGFSMSVAGWTLMAHGVPDALMPQRMLCE